MPTQVLVSITPALKSFFENDCVADGAKDLVDKECVDLDELYRLADEHSKAGGAEVKLHELMQGSEVVDRIEEEPTGPDGAPLSEIEKMRLQSQERAYQKMVDGVAPLTGQKRVEPSLHQRGLRFATNFGTQVIVAFIGGFILGYYFVENFVAPDSFSAKVIGGAACSFGTLLLETLLLVVHEHRLDICEASREKHKKRKEAARAKARVVRLSEKEDEKVSGCAEPPKADNEKKDD
eukprot:TRINITY_DN7062_c1_g1_i1.p1 TRINITY_DN7062_c1_g1~~TRINITY_DN7062_c1_g1_i1.p1  ORF type:complete len:236 (+),score=53.87 TRINITY_DN7062_c1_g1_i1:133-840(+)